MAPLSPPYERLETGMGPAPAGNKRFYERSDGKKRFAWKRFALGAAVIIALVWFFGPRRDQLPSWGTSSESEGTAISRPKLDEVDLDPLPPPPEPTVRPHTDEDADASKQTPRPTSPATDPDPLKTVYCSKPYKSGGRLVQYALMIDAGSTGSRIHIYKFNNCGASPEYEYEVFKMTKPGLSSYKGRPVDAAASLDVLLDEALAIVPESLRKCTPVAVKATAGLRLLGPEQSDSILNAVRHHLHEKYPFPLDDREGVVIMDGKDEGVFAWITANYLLNTIRANTPSGTPPYAVLDLGGGSTQIVFEPSFDTSRPDSRLEEGEHKYDLKFGGNDHVLYQHSYLGYGLMSARKSVHQLVDFMSTIRPSSKAGEIVGNPCLSKGTQRVVEIEDERSKKDYNVTMAGQDVGGFEACNRIVQLVMAKDAICEVKPCSFNGVYQPSLMETFPAGKVLLLSYFYDRIQPLLSKRSPPKLTVSTLATLAHDVCEGRPSWLKKWGSNKEAMEELEGRPEYCLDLTFMHALLRLGYEFGDDREVMIGKQIEGTELGWCLGATISIVGAELKCRA